VGDLAGRRPARATPRRDRRRRAGRHHHYARPRRPGPLLPAARRGMAPPLSAACRGVRTRRRQPRRDPASAP
jgi:hypothetical protein